MAAENSPFILLLQFYLFTAVEPEIIILDKELGKEK